MDNYDELGNYIPDNSEIELTRPYTEEELAERKAWCDQMSELAALVCAPMTAERM